MNSLTSAVGVHHKTLVDMVLDEQESLLEDLAGTRLPDCVGIPWIPEESEQLSWSPRLTGGMRGRHMVSENNTVQEKSVFPLYSILLEHEMHVNHS